VKRRSVCDGKPKIKLGRVGYREFGSLLIVFESLVLHSNSSTHAAQSEAEELTFKVHSSPRAVSEPFSSTG
jgi:hypothetical protein